jgi:predicted GTPase
MGYTREQVGELEATIRAAACDVVLIATPVDLRRLLRIDQPTCRVTYEFADIGHPSLAEVLSEFIAKAQQRG